MYIRYSMLYSPDYHIHVNNEIIYIEMKFTKISNPTILI